MSPLLVLAGVLLLLGSTSGLHLPALKDDTPDQKLNVRTERENHCRDDEYKYKGICCVKCPKGTYVEEHCKADHLQGKCDSCVEGENYTAHANGIDHCVGCTACKDDKVLVRACTLTADAECQCKPGTYCLPSESCEVCSLCPRSTTAVQEIGQLCNATTPTEQLPGPATKGEGLNDLENSGQGVWTVIGILLLFVIIIGLIILIFIVKKIRSKGRENTTNDVESSLLATGSSNATIASGASEPNGSAENISTCEFEDAENPCNAAAAGDSAPHVQSSGARETPCTSESDSEIITEDQRDEIFYTFIDEVPNKDWKRFMRIIGLKNNDIDHMISDNPHDVKERNFGMLSSWRNKLGRDATKDKLFNALDQMGLGGCKENIMNNLKNILPNL
ncbi:tumor necrosis factor receptor superfamily member 1A-like [Ascaphus truei]|uniref:tumor necrosis factor receptor superfamily member 1A-like n=1 Tax=Ascaphus truei TaxID=8439 RepID=UPI003F59A9F6